MSKDILFEESKPRHDSHCIGGLRRGEQTRKIVQLELDLVSCSIVCEHRSNAYWPKIPYCP